MPRSPSKRRGASKEEEGAKETAVPKCGQKVMFMKDSLLATNDIQLIKLKHPRTSKSATFVLDNDSKQLFELISFNEEFRCWFLGSTVQSDGQVYITTPVHLTYLVLPYLMQADKNVPLDHLLVDPDFPAITHLSALAAGKTFSHIADRKGSPELGVWRYNEESTLAWLEGRVRRLSKFLQDKKVPTSSGQSFTYVRAMNLDQTQEAYLALSHGIISDYLPEKLSSALHTRLKLPEPTTKNKASTGAENQPPAKKQKTSGPAEDYSKNDVKAVKSQTPQSAKAKALAKSASGSKSITSFFTKK